MIIRSASTLSDGACAAPGILLSKLCESHLYGIYTINSLTWLSDSIHSLLIPNHSLVLFLH